LFFWRRGCDAVVWLVMLLVVVVVTVKGGKC